MDLRGLLLREGRRGKRGGEERGGSRREVRGVKRRRGEGGGGGGEEAFLVTWPRRLSALNPPLSRGKDNDQQNPSKMIM